MNPELRTRAEARLADAAAALGLADPRPPYRERLRQLRELEPASFEQAIRHYDHHVLPALAETDPISAWLDYGKYLAALTAPAEPTVIDGTGRAQPLDAPVQPGALVLFLPDDTAAPPLVALQPAAPSAAQQATLALLVGRKLSLE